MKYQLKSIKRPTIRPNYLLIILEEAPHQDSGTLLTVPNKPCVVQRTISIQLITTAAPAAVPDPS